MPALLRTQVRNNGNTGRFEHAVAADGWIARSVARCVGGRFSDELQELGPVDALAAIGIDFVEDRFRKQSAAPRSGCCESAHVPSGRKA